MPNVYIFRSNEESGYGFLEKPFQIDIIGVAAPNLHSTRRGVIQVNDPRYKDDLKSKFRIIFEIAILNEIDTLVLGAIGKLKI